VSHNFEKLFSDVIWANGIFERQVEFVGRLQHVIALGIGDMQWVFCTSQVLATLTENIDVDVFAQLFDVRFSLAVCITMGSHPGN
jgi:hypothetical protein